MLIEFVERELCIAWGSIRLFAAPRFRGDLAARGRDEIGPWVHYNKIAIAIGGAGKKKKEMLSPGAARESTGALYSDKMILSIVNAPARRPMPVLWNAQIYIRSLATWSGELSVGATKLFWKRRMKERGHCPAKFYNFIIEKKKEEDNISGQDSTLLLDYTSRIIRNWIKNNIDI